MKNLISKYVLTAKGLGTLMLLTVIGVCAYGMQPNWGVWALQTVCWTAIVFIQKYTE